MQILTIPSEKSLSEHLYAPGTGGCCGRNEPDAAAGKRQEGTGGTKRKDGRGEAFEEAFPGRITGKMTIPTGASPAGFLLPRVSFYGILWQERNGFQRVSSSKLKAVLLLFDYFSLPRFAPFCLDLRGDDFGLRKNDQI